MASATMAPAALSNIRTYPVSLQTTGSNAPERCARYCTRASLKSGVEGLVLPAKLAARHSTASLHSLHSRRVRALGGVKTVAAVATAVSWQELHGAKDWAGLLEVPAEGGKKLLHPQLAQVVQKYGELVQATYDGFIADDADEVYGGKNMYTRKELLDKSLPAASLARTEGYQIVKYMHSSSGLASLYGKDSWIYKLIGDKKDRQVWAGYIAYKVIDPKASVQEIEIVVAFRGTILLKEWVSNAVGDSQKPWLGYGKAGVHNGFQQIYRDDGDLEDADDSLYNKFITSEKAVAKGSPQDEVHKTILDLASKYKVRNIVAVGHSLGAALATICALDVGQFVKDDPKAKKQFSKAGPPPVTGFVFASPRVGNQEFSDLFAKYNVKLFRTTDIPDVVPKVPGVFEYDEKDAIKTGWGNAVKNYVVAWIDKKNVLPDWVEVGTEVKVDYRNSKILKADKGKPAEILGRFHNMEVQLYLLVTQLGGQKEPTVGVEPGPGERHYRLCNKSDNTLIPEFAELNTPPIPPSWWKTRPDKGSGIPSSDPEEC